MSKFRELDRLLDEKMPISYWSDVQQFRVRDFVAEMTAEDWLELEHSWQHKDADWQSRLCEVLAGPNANPRAVSMLLNLMESSDRNTALMAADALRDFDVNLLTAHRAQIESKLQVLQSDGRIAQKICSELVKKLGPKT